MFSNFYIQFEKTSDMYIYVSEIQNLFNQSINIQHEISNSTETFDQSNGNHNNVNNSTEFLDQSNDSHNDVNKLNDSSPNSPINESENSLNNNSNEQTNDYFINDNDETSSDSVSDDNHANTTVSQLNFSKTNFQIIRQKVDKYVYNNNVEAPKIYINPEAYLTRIGQKNFILNHSTFFVIIILLDMQRQSQMAVM